MTRRSFSISKVTRRIRVARRVVTVGIIVIVYTGSNYLYGALAITGRPSVFSDLGFFKLLSSEKNSAFSLILYFHQTSLDCSHISWHHPDGRNLVMWSFRKSCKTFLRTARALIDVHGEQMTLRHDDQSVTFKVGDTKTLSYNIIETVNRVDVIDIACEEYVQEVLEISESGNPTSTSGLTIDSRSPSFIPFGGSDFLMEEIDAFLEHDDSIPPGVDGIYDSEGDTVYLEELLSVINSDPNLPPSPVCELCA
ncbi:hypothetical protein Tco_1058520 [Tanacetum coccineum]|uniref:Reverse transcriptase domain-containing protein n=1 Tax=Tanacetum coccineum TaxID=301880 RepID=A0ABQ5H901_9ASTR